jgi:hypothetical protein
MYSSPSPQFLIQQNTNQNNQSLIDTVKADKAMEAQQ